MNKGVTEARYIKPDGGEQVVQLRSAPLRDGNVRYDPLKHDRVYCLCCSAELRERAGKISRGGSSGVGQSPYFSPVRRHDPDCILPLHRPSSAPSQKIDRTKGYRLHIDTLQFSDVFNERSGAYEISEGGRITIDDPDLRDREAYAVDDLKGIVAFMQKANPARLADTKVIFRNKAIDWDRFFVPLSDPHAVAWLADTAHKRGKGEAPPFVLLQVETTRYFAQGRRGKAQPVPLDPVSAGVTKAMRQREVQVNIYLDDRRSSGVTWGFNQPGSYLVLGLARHGVRNESGNKVRDWLNVTIRDHRQIQNMKFIENAPAKGAKPAPSGP